MKKEADFNDILDRVKAMWKPIKALGTQQARKYTVPTLGLMIGAGLANKIRDSRNNAYKKELHDQLVGSYQAVLNYGNIDASEPLIRTRFEEIAQHSPTVALSPSVASKVIKRTLDTGLTDDDLDRLYKIEHNQHGVKHLKGLSFPESTSEKFVKETIGPGLGFLGGQTAWMLAGDPLQPHEIDPSAKPMGHSDSSGMVNMDTNEDVKPEVIKSILAQPPKRGKNTQALLVDRIKKAKGQRLYIPDFGANEVSARARALNEDKIPVHPIFHTANSNPKFLEKTKELHELALKKPYNPDAVQFVLSLRDLYQDSPDALDMYPIIKHLSPESEKKGSAMTNEQDLELATHILADQYTLIKSAAPKSLNGMLMGLMGAAAVGLGVGGAHQIGSYFQTKKLTDKIMDSWKETSNTLKKLSDEGSRVVSGVDYSDPETQRKAQGAFKTLADIAPVLASNPMLATTFVNTVMQNEGQVGIDTAKTISEIQKNLKSEYSSPFAKAPGVQGFDSGFNMAGGKDLVKGVAEAWD